MRAHLEGNKIYLKSGSTDLRKAATGLAVPVEEEMGEKPLSGHIFLFCNKSRTLLKALWWDKTGFWLCQKYLITGETANTAVPQIVSKGYAEYVKYRDIIDLLNKLPPENLANVKPFLLSAIDVELKKTVK